MLRNSLKRLLGKLKDNNQIELSLHEELSTLINGPLHHKKLRSELMMVLHPIRVNTSGKHQDTAIFKIINRVSYGY